MDEGCFAQLVTVWAKSHSEAAALFAAVAWPDNCVSRRVIDRIGFKDAKMAYYYYHAEVVDYAFAKRSI